jgi:hypothetical protein
MLKPIPAPLPMSRGRWIARQEELHACHPPEGQAGLWRCECGTYYRLEVWHDGWSCIPITRGQARELKRKIRKTR